MEWAQTLDAPTANGVFVMRHRISHPLTRTSPCEVDRLTRSLSDFAKIIDAIPEPREREPNRLSHEAHLRTCSVFAGRDRAQRQQSAAMTSSFFLSPSITSRPTPLLPGG